MQAKRENSCMTQCVRLRGSLMAAIVFTTAITADCVAINSQH